MTQHPNQTFIDQIIDANFKSVLRNNLIADIHYKHSPAIDEISRLKFVIVEMHKVHERHINNTLQTQHKLPSFVVENKLGRENNND